MIKTFRTAFLLKNTYRVNTILYAIKQIPLLNRLLPQAIYRVYGLKIFANILAVLWELVSIFLGKALYFATLVCGVGVLYETVPADEVFAHILLFLSVIGSFMNTAMFNPTRDKYYALVLMRMDAREYVLTDYGYAMLKVVVGFFPLSALFGLGWGVPFWFCLLIPFAVVGFKLTAAACSLLDYKRTGNVRNENRLGKATWLVVGLLLAAAYGLPAVGITLPLLAVAVIFAAAILTGAVSIGLIWRFPDYGLMYRQLLSQMMHQLDQVNRHVRESSYKSISADTTIVSRRKGFEFLNELFIKRHRSILWKPAVRITYICLFLVLGVLLAFFLRPELKSVVNRVLMTFLPYFVFIMYMINRGTGFTRALFINCDHSLLTYSFYKRPEMVLKLFAIRLREIIKINLLPALTLGAGLAVLLYASGGTDNYWNYVILVVSVASMSVFFSVHYLTIYYLLQPYTVSTEVKSGTYQLVLSATYLVCFFMMELRMPIFVFGILCILFCVLYCIVACLLIYRFAPKTFRLRR